MCSGCLVGEGLRGWGGVGLEQGWREVRERRNPGGFGLCTLELVAGGGARKEQVGGLSLH